MATFDLDSTSTVLVVIQLDFEMKESHFLEWSIFSLKNQIGWISWSLFSFSINQLIFWALEFQMIIDFAHFISKYLFWINCLKDNYGFLEFTISDLSNADTVLIVLWGLLVPGHVFSCKYSKRAEISSPPIWWYHELSWLQLQWLVRFRLTSVEIFELVS